MFNLQRIPLAILFLASLSAAQDMHDHPAPEKLGRVSFPVSCSPSLQADFNRGVALLHSFAYTDAERAFHGVAQLDAGCAMAHWGAAMTHYHQLWDPPLPPGAAAAGQAEIELAKKIGAKSDRERQLIAALELIFKDAGTVPYRTRAAAYEHAMSALAANNPQDVEIQVFAALALLATAPPTDKTHANQKQAIAILEPLYATNPDHPGIPHYLIHACDNTELAARGLPAARAYSLIAPSAPHALHMPSHIFTRLGLWNDSIASNLAARASAHLHGDTGEELHAMDYLVYAYLQAGRDKDANQVIQDLKAMPKLDAGNFKIAYAATAMPIRYAVERRQWTAAANIVPPAGAPPHVVAIAVWARGIGLARIRRPTEAAAEARKLHEIEKQLQSSGSDYWATQVEILAREVEAWAAQANGKPQEAESLLRSAADQEDAIEKLPVTPGPILPAREQLGSLLVEQHHPGQALKEFHATLINAPGRRGAIQGAAQATKLGKPN